MGEAREMEGNVKKGGGTIRCRAKCDPDCYDGRPATDIYEDEGMAGDGTYDGTSVICDACFIRLGL